MKIRMTRARLAVGGVLVAGLLGLPQPDAKADCVWLQVYVKRKNTDPLWVYGQSNPCVVPTPWNTTIEHQDNDNTNLVVHPDGVPNGSYIEARIPLP